MATAIITITIERDIPDSGSGGPDLGHDAYAMKKTIEGMGFKGDLKVVGIETEQRLPR